MTGLDDAGVHRADRNLVHPFPADRRERKRPPVVGKRRRVRILAQRVIVLGPERVLHQRTRIRVTEDVDAEQIAQLALEARRRIVRRRHRRQLGPPSVQADRCVDEPVRRAVGEHVVDEEHARLAAAIVAGNRNQLGAEIAAYEVGEAVDADRRQLAVDLVGARRHDARRVSEALVQRADD